MRRASIRAERLDKVAPVMPLPIETTRLLIRELTMDDLEPFHAVFSDAEVMARIPTGPSRDLDHSRERLQWMLDHQEKYGFSLWAVIERETGAMIGDCGFVMLDGTGPEIELAYHLARDRWGNGYGGEAARACLDYAFEELALSRVVAVTDPTHFVSRRVMEKVGMHLEGKVHAYGTEMVQYAILGMEDTA